MKIFLSPDFTGFTEIFHLLSHSIFLIWPHFYDKFLEKCIRLIFLAHFTTTTYGLYHSRYSFWQVHFRHLILHVRLLCNMIVDIHCDLCIWITHDILYNFGIHCIFPLSQKKKFLDCNPKTFDYLAFMGIKINLLAVPT